MAKDLRKQKLRLLPFSVPALTFLLGVTGFFLLTSDVAQASPEQCRAIHSELNELQTLIAARPTKKALRFHKLVNQQRSALKGARRDAVGFGCITRSGKRTGRGTTSCPALLTKIGKMERNLRKLQTKKEAAGSVLSQSEKNKLKSKQRKLRQQSQRLSCNTPSRHAQKDETRKKRPSFIARLFGGFNTRRGRYSNREVLRTVPSEEENLPIGRVVRTLCVRVCDGYYFPISFATTRQSFDVDQSICEASNTSTEMRLFFHSNPGQDIIDMQDLTGQLYADLPNAFRHQREVVDPQQCPRFAQPSQFTKVAGYGYENKIAERQRQYGNVYGDFENQPPEPEAKPNIFSDPDTRLAEVGSFQFNPKRQIAPQAEVAKGPVAYDPNTVAEAGIRVIGPTFLDDRQSVELLLAPDHVQVQ